MHVSIFEQLIYTAVDWQTTVASKTVVPHATISDGSNHGRRFACLHTTLFVGERTCALKEKWTTKSDKSYIPLRPATWAGIIISLRKSSCDRLSLPNDIEPSPFSLNLINVQNARLRGLPRWDCGSRHSLNGTSLPDHQACYRHLQHRASPSLLGLQSRHLRR